METRELKGHSARAVFALFASALIVSCGGQARTPPPPLGPYGLNPEHASFEVQCLTDPPPPPLPPGQSGDPRMSKQLPDTLPKVIFPIEIKECNGLAGEPPHFYGGEMPAFTASVDCNAQVVRFKSRDWQITEASSISPDGALDARVLYITRLVKDSEGTENCWARLMGHVTGNVSCAGGAANAHVELKVDWHFDPTPPEIMETPAPNLADLRNGKHCKVTPENCFFSNQGSFGCGG